MTDERPPDQDDDSNKRTPAPGEGVRIIGAEEAAEAAQARAESVALASLSSSVLSGDDTAQALVERLRDTFGLVAAALLVQAARAAPVPVECRNATTGSDWVAAASMAQVAVLAVLRDHELELRASGPGAHEAVHTLVALVERGFQDPAPAG